METNRFVISRDDGRSDAEVLIDLVQKRDPGDLLSYDDLAKDLSLGTNRKYERTDVQSSVNRAERKLAVTAQRALLNVRNQGYRVALASEHQTIAGRKRERSEKLLKRGLIVLQHVDWSAMDDNERRAHEGQLLIVGGLYSAMQGIDNRLSRIEKALGNRNATKD
jgi:hypothetical protein